MHHQPRKVGDDFIAGWIAVDGYQLLIMVGHVLWDTEQQLWGCEARVRAHDGIGDTAYVQHHVVVGSVAVMAMGEPVAGLVVYLHVAHPKCPVDFHLGIEEVRTGMAVVQAGVDNLHRPVVDGLQRLEGEQFVFPTIVQECFHKRGG